MPGDFQIGVGVTKTIIPGFTKNGAAVSAPDGSTFNWVSSVPTAVTFSDPSAASPTIRGEAPTDAATPITITGTHMAAGFTHVVSHTLDVVTVADPIDSFDFVIA